MSNKSQQVRDHSDKSLNLNLKPALFTNGNISDMRARISKDASAPLRRALIPRRGAPANSNFRLNV